MLIVTVVAIVDLDNTLVRGSYLFHLGASLVRQGMLSPRHLVPFLMAEFRYSRDREEPPGMPMRVAACVLALVRGQDQAALRDTCREFVDESLDRFVVPEVRRALTDLMHLGIPVYVATASPQELAEAVADRLGMAGALGTVSEVRDGRYTGLLASPIMHGAEKLVRVQALLADVGADASISWAFSDSINDLPLLSAVGWPVAVNPDAELRDVARRNGWLTIDSSRLRSGPGRGARVRRGRSASVEPVLDPTDVPAWEFL